MDERELQDLRSLSDEFQDGTLERTTRQFDRLGAALGLLLEEYDRAVKSTAPEESGNLHTVRYPDGSLLAKCASARSARRVKSIMMDRIGLLVKVNRLRDFVCFVSWRQDVYDDCLRQELAKVASL